MNRWARPSAIACLSWAFGIGGATAHEGARFALERLAAQISRVPTDVDSRMQRVDLLRRQRRVQEARRELDAARAHAPEDPRVSLLAGLIAADAHEPAAATNHLRDFVAKGGRDARAHLALARISEERGEIANALLEHEAAARIRPDPDTFLAWGALLERGRDLRRAAKVYRRGLRVMGDSIVLRRELVRVLIDARAYREALAMIGQAMSTAPLRAPWRFERARVLRRQGRGTRARRELRLALAEVEHRMTRRPSAATRELRARIQRALAERRLGNAP
jgi:tetratricopeptide (TPR) repeat protein